MRPVAEDSDLKQEEQKKFHERCAQKRCFKMGQAWFGIGVVDLSGFWNSATETGSGIV